MLPQIINTYEMFLKLERVSVMDAVKVYEEYFNKKYNVICNLIDNILSRNKKIAAWGAGARGKAFLSTFDARNEKIYCVFDIDEKRCNTKLPTGHVIMKYEEQPVDYIFVMNSINEVDVKELLLENGIDSEVINLDNIILGDLELENLLYNQKKELCKVREVKVAAVCILYNPGNEVIENIMSYVKNVEILYVYDNSEKQNKILIEELKKIENVIYITSGMNDGIAKAINITGKMAIKAGMDWLVTFDQDSYAEKRMFEQMKKYANSSLCSNDIGIIAPSCSYNTREIHGNYSMYYSYFDKVMQSGAMNNLSILETTGGYDENLFIDQVDYEYCVRIRLFGYKIIKINNALLKHNVNDENVEIKNIDGCKIYINKYSGSRYYYIYRNNRYLARKYQDKDDIYFLECEKNLCNIVKNLEYDNDIEIKRRAIEIAERDYKNLIMGRCLHDL